MQKEEQPLTRLSAKLALEGRLRNRIITKLNVAQLFH